MPSISISSKHILRIIYGEILLYWLFHLHAFSGLTVFGNLSSPLIYFFTKLSIVIDFIRTGTLEGEEQEELEPNDMNFCPHGYLFFNILLAY